MVAKFCWCSADYRNRPDTAVDGTPFTPFGCGRISINQEPDAIGKPDRNLFHAWVLEPSQLWNRATLSGINGLNVQPPGVAICQVFAVGGNRATDYRVFAGVNCELTYLDFRHNRY